LNIVVRRYIITPNLASILIVPLSNDSSIQTINFQHLFKKGINAQPVFIAAVLIFVLLFSFISHGQHYNLVIDDAANISAEQDCHLCQNSIDNTNNKLEIFQPLFTFYLACCAVIHQSFLHSNYYVLPPLRAPPVHHYF